MITNLIINLLIVSLIAILLLGGVIFYLYWWLIQRATPELDGEMRRADSNPKEVGSPDRRLHSGGRSNNLS